jgi:hypothetical protein
MHDIIEIQRQGHLMKNLKIYLDTSVLSYLQQEDIPKEMNITLGLWDKIKMCKYNVNT